MVRSNKTTNQRSNRIMKNMKLIKTQDYLLLIDKEAEIKENTNTFKEGINGDWYWNSKYNFVSNNGDITAFDFKIIAYRPLTKEAKELDLPLLPSFEEADIEKLAETHAFNWHEKEDRKICKESFIEGYKAAQSSNKQFSLEDMKKAIDLTQQICDKNAHYVQRDRNVHVPMITIDEEEEIIQSLSIQQLPKEFAP